MFLQGEAIQCKKANTSGGDSGGLN
jgi:hypothetical protein